MVDQRATLVVLAVSIFATLGACLLFTLARLLRPRLEFRQRAKLVYRFRWVAQAFIFDEHGRRQSLPITGTVFAPTAEDAYQAALNAFARSATRLGILERESITLDLR
jgi:hypothetical protein